MWPVPESATPTGTGDPSLWEPPPGDFDGKRSGPTASAGSASAEPVHGTNATEPPRAADRFAGRSCGVVRAEASGSHPNWLVEAKVFTVPDRCVGLVRHSVTAPRRQRGRATGDRADNAASPAEPSGTTGDVRSSERLTPAGRPVVDGSPHLGLPRAAQWLRPQRSRGGSRFRRTPAPVVRRTRHTTSSHHSLYCGSSPLMARW